MCKIKTADRLPVGTRVQYGKPFLRSICAGPTDPMWRAKGTVTTVTPFGTAPNASVVVEVQWDHGDTGRILASNLHIIGRLCASEA